MRPVGSTSGRPRVGAPDGPGRTKRPSSPRSKRCDLGRPAGVDGRDAVLRRSSPVRPACAPSRHRRAARPRPVEARAISIRSTVSPAVRHAAVAGSCKDCGTRSVEVSGKIARQRIEIAKAEIERQGAMQRSVLRPSDPSAAAARSRPGGRCAARRRHAAEHMQPVADLHLLEIAEMRVERAQGVVGRRIPRHIDVRIEPLRPRQRQDVFGEHGGALRIEVGGERILVDQRLQPREVVVHSARVSGGVR